MTNRKASLQRQLTQARNELQRYQIALITANPAQRSILRGRIQGVRTTINYLEAQLKELNK